MNLNFLSLSDLMLSLSDLAAPLIGLGIIVLVVDALERRGWL